MISSAYPSTKKSITVIGLLLVVVFANVMSPYTQNAALYDYAFLLATVDFTLLTLIMTAVPLIVGASQKYCFMKFINVLSAVNSIVLFAAAIALYACGITDEMLLGWMTALLYFFINKHLFVLMHRNVHSRKTRVITACVVLALLGCTALGSLPGTQAILQQSASADTTEEIYDYYVDIDGNITRKKRQG